MPGSIFATHLVLLPDILQGCLGWQTSWESHSGSVVALNWSVPLTTVTLIIQMAQFTQEHIVFLFGILIPKLRLQLCVFTSFIKASASWKSKWSSSLTCVARYRDQALKFTCTPHLSGILTAYHEEGTVTVFSPCWGKQSSGILNTVSDAIQLSKHWARIQTHICRIMCSRKNRRNRLGGSGGDFQSSWSL